MTNRMSDEPEDPADETGILPDSHELRKWIVPDADPPPDPGVLRIMGHEFRIPLESLPGDEKPKE